MDHKQDNALASQPENLAELELAVAAELSADPTSVSAFEADSAGLAVYIEIPANMRRWVAADAVAQLVRECALRVSATEPGLLVLAETPHNADPELDALALRAHRAELWRAGAVGAFAVYRDGQRVDSDAPATDEPSEEDATIAECVLETWREFLPGRVIGLDTDFFALGGNSLVAAEMVLAIEERLSVSIPSAALFDSSTPRALVRIIQQSGDAASQHRIVFELAPREPYLELSAAQARMRFLWQMDPESGAYNICGALRLRGELDEGRLRACLASLVRRHESLRTSFPEHAGQAFQHIAEHVDVKLVRETLPEGDNDAALGALLTTESLLPFELAAGPLLRLRLIALGEADHVLVMTLHHSIADGASMNVLVGELAELYRTASTPDALSLRPVQYLDYSVWQKQRLDAGEGQRQLGYWREQLGDERTVLELPSDRSRPSKPSSAGGRVAFQLPKQLTLCLRAMGEQRGVSQFTLLFSAFGALLQRYSGARDFCIGIPVANRIGTRGRGVVGCCVNTLAVRLQLDGSETFDSLVRRVKGQLAGAQAHQELPFEQLVEHLQPERSAGHAPLFQVMHNHQFRDLRALENLLGLNCELVEIHSPVARCDLSLNSEEDPSGALTLAFVYAADLFDKERIERMAQHLVQLLDHLVAAPELPIAVHSLLSERERSEIEGWSSSPQYTSEHEFVQERVAAQAVLRPTATALVFGEQFINYAELEHRVQALAWRLRTSGVGPNCIVGILLERSTEMVVAVLGVLRAGAAYLPLDSAYPEDRLSYLVCDAHVDTIVTVGTTPSWCAELGVRTLNVAVGEVGDARELQTREAPLSAPHALDLSYVLYTSGTTGMPKAVGNTHQALTLRLDWMQREYRLSPDETLLHKTPLSFDVSVWELLWPLMVGARLVIAAPGDHRDPLQLSRLIQRHNITTVHFVPSLLREFVSLPKSAECKSLGRLFSGGEALPVSLLHSVCERLPGARIDNRYGPTEALINATYWQCSSEDQGTVPIGRPIPGTSAHILDSGLNAQPVGLEGELLLGGVCLARGYLGSPGRTAERFVPDPFASQPGQRLYRSGDFARLRQDGVIEFVGRKDHQVKVRGMRVELGELEAALLALPGVRAAVATAALGPAGDVRLLGYVVADAWDGSALAALERTLPAQLVPAQVICLEELPRLVSGKVDRRSLPEPKWETEVYVAPQDTYEQRIAGIWQQVLGVERVGIHDEFFALGGHSLLATRVVARARQEFEIELPLRDLFESRDLKAFAARARQAVEGKRVNRQPTLRRVDRNGLLPLSLPQERMWFLWSIEPESSAYNVAGSVTLRGELDGASLRRALAALIERHEALRTSFPRVNGAPVQHIVERCELPFSELDLSSLSSADAAAQLEVVSQAEAERPFDLEHGSVLRVTLVRLGETEHRLLVTLHHIVAEGWAMDVLAREWIALYQAFLSGESSPLSPLACQYVDYAAWQREWLASGEAERQVAYWRDTLGREHPVLDLPADRPRPAVQSFRGDYHRFSVNAGLSRQVHAFGRRRGVTLSMTVMTALFALLHRYSGQRDLRVGYPIANRVRPEFEGLIGAFLNTQVLRCEVNAELSAEALLERVKFGSLDAQSHQDLPFHRIVEALQPERSAAHTPLFQVMCNVQRWDFQQAIQLGPLSLQFTPNDARAAQFDLAFDVSEVGDHIECAFSYSSDLFDRRRVENMARHWLQLLRGVIESPETRIGELSMLAEAESHSLLAGARGWGRAVDALPVHELFERQVVTFGDVIAVRMGDATLTYAELNARANQLAGVLRKRGVKPGALVGLCRERSLDLVVGLLATLKAGAGCLPLDPEYPSARLHYMLKDSGVGFVLTHSSLTAALHDDGNNERFVTWCFDRDSAGLIDEAQNNLESFNSPADVVYCIYTSGSTGQPKGVLNTHAGVVNRLRWMQSEIGLVAQDKLLQKTSFSFDVAFGEILLPLLHGAELVLAPVGAQRDPNELGDAVRRYAVTCIDFVPAQLSAFAASGELGRCPSLRMITVGGEALPWDLVQTVKAASSVELYNMYGPTEASIDVSCWRCVTSGTQSVSLGSPAWNTALYVLDGQMNPVAPGVTGELYIGGAALARGYLSRGGLTASRFVPSPFSGEQGQRLYRSGDLARTRADGLLEYAGRVDDQIKLRGYRIELGEIQSRLLGHREVQAAAVVVRDVAATRQLIAFVSGAQLAPECEQELKTWLAQQLPQYMVPMRVVRLERMPLTENGKLNIAALPALEAEKPAGYVAPASEAECVLADIWSELLGIEAVSADANFFELGGDSIISLQVVSRARARGVEVVARDIFQYQSVRELAAVARVTAVGVSDGAKRAAQDALELTASDHAKLRALGLDPATVEDLYELTPMQEGMLFHSVFGSEGSEYVSQLCVDIEGLDAARFETAWRAVVQRHAVLRTSFVEVSSGKFMQVVRRSAVVNVRQAWAETAADVALAATQERAAFELGHAPLMRWLLLELRQGKSSFVWTHHHALLDGWSAAQLLGEVLEHYAGGKPREQAGSYRDHIVWLRQRDVSKDQEFWRTRVQQLATPSHLGNLLTGEGQGYCEQKEHWTEAETAELQSYARRERVTVNTLIQAAWLLLLQAYTGETTVCFGATVSGRSPEVAGSESLIGLFINTVTLVSRVEGAAPVGEWLRALQASNAELREHEQTPLNEVQRLWGRGGQALFDTLLVFENYPMDRALRQGGASDLRFGAVQSLDETHYALTVEVNAMEHGLVVSYGHQRERISERNVKEVGLRLRQLVHELAKSSQRRVHEVPRLTSEERATALSLSAGDVRATRETSLAEAFEEQVKRTPEAVALKTGAEVVSYAELNGRANQLARGLRARGVGANTLVALCVERSVSMVVGVLGVLKAGAAYLPLDPEYPRERLTYMLEDSGAKLLLADAAHAGLLADAGVQTLRLDADWSEVAGESRVNLCLPGSGDQAAYCIYTSGSTGRPKGVVGTQRGVLNRLGWLQSELQLTAADRVLQKTSLSFDVSVGEILWPLLNGGQLVLGSVGVQRDAEQLLRELIAEQITLLDVVPAQLGALATVEGLEQCTSLRCVTVGGEALPLETARAFRARHAAQLVNMYGPTEASIDVTYWRYDERERGRAPLGRPMSNTSVYVLNGELEPMGSGMLGELYIGGVALAHGYHGRAGLTGERFVPSPFVSGERLYRAGDLGRYRADGTLEYAGRVDDQVKVRGYRIELGEVEAKLVEHPAVGAAAVAVKQLGASRQLVGYVVGREGEVSAQELRSFLAERLPEYMVPAHLVNLQTLPLLANGKLDRKALPDPEVTGSASYVAPETAIERELAQIWSELLAVPDVSVEANFFELGGDSILSLQVVSRARARGIELTPKQVFEQQTIRGLGQVATFELRSPSRGIARRPAKGEVALTAIQRRFFAEATGNKAHFNQALMLKPRRVLDGALLTQALNAVIAHHDALRLRYEQTPSGTWRQAYADVSAASAHACLWQRAASSEAEQTQLSTEAQRSFDLSAGPLLRAVLFSRWDGSQRLLMAVHHLVIDGVSWRMLLEDLETAYEQLRSGALINLTQTTSSFGEWAEVLEQYAHGPQAPRELAYYEQQARLSAALSFPSGLGDLSTRVGDSEEVRLQLSQERTRQLLREAPSAYRTQVNDLLLTALSRALCSWSGERAAWIELESHGRVDAVSSLDVGRTLGWFTSLYPILLTPVNGTATAIADSICSVKERLRAVPSSGAGYAALEAYAEPSTQQALGERPHLTFNYLGQLDAGQQDAGLWQLTAEPIGESQDAETPLLNWVTFNAEVVGGQLRLSVSYSPHMYERQNMQHLAQLFVSELEAVIEHCVQSSSRGATASDFELSGLTQAKLERLNLDLGQVEDIYPLSPMQLGMLFHSLSGTAGDYVSQLKIEVEGADRARFEAAWCEIVKRHEVLRTSFVESVDGEFLQVVHKSGQVEVRTQQATDAGSSELELWAEQERLGLELGRAPLMRWLLIELGAGKGLFIWTHHHLLLDGWSASQLLGEVLEQYEGARLRPKRGSYRNHIAWLKQRDVNREEQFWKTQLRSISAPSLLAHALRPSPDATGRGTIERNVSFADTQRLVTFAQREHVTLNTLVQTAWAIVLQRYTRQAHVCFGATVSGRVPAVPGSETTIGLFINSLPVIVAPAPNHSVGVVLRAMQTHNTTLREYEHTPLYDIQRWRGRTGQALFDSLLVFENYPVDRALRERRESDLRFGAVTATDQTNYPLTIEVSSGETGLLLAFNYDRSQLADGEVTRLAGHLAHVVEQLVGDARRPIGELGLLTAEEELEQVTWNATERNFDSATSLQQAFERQVERTPDGVALIYGSQQLSYRELNARCNQLAHYLISRGVGRDVLVGVCAERSLELVVALYAVLKAGGAYVPLDPDYPAERLDYMLKDSAPPLVLSQERLTQRLPAETQLEVWCLDRDWPTLEVWPNHNPRIEVTGANLAYCIYTSGSTGRPKGAVNVHSAVLNRIDWMQAEYQLTTQDRVLQKTPYSFDVSVWEFFWPLLYGAALVVAEPGAHKEPRALREAIVAHRVTTIHFVPSMLRAFVESGELGACTPLRQVMCSGEALPSDLVQAFFADSQAELHNLYGPTEAAIDVSYWRCSEPSSALSIPIGRPIANVTLHVLDPQLKASGLGVAGEVYIGGAGLARGYHGRAALTAERFIPSPYVPGERMYRTGDVGRFIDGGVLEYLGRADDQVKVRGYRIELGEIEAKLLEYPDVCGAAVAVKLLGQSRQLVGYLVSSGHVELSAVRLWLAERLPEYMVPAQLVSVVELPLTASGKLDRKALPEPDVGQQNYVAPETENERILAQIWSELLGIEAVSVDANFFELGGDSILSLQVVSRARARGVEVTARQLFQQQTVRGLSQIATRTSQGVTNSISASSTDFGFVEHELIELRTRLQDGELAEVEDIYPLTAMQEGMVFHSRYGADAALYVNQLWVAVEGLDRQRFERAWQRVAERHEALRTSFQELSSGRQVQVVYTNVIIEVRVQDGRGAAIQQQHWLNEERQRVELTQAPLMRWLLVALDSDKQLLIWTHHHVLLDGWSAAQLLGEVLEVYNGAKSREQLGRYRDHIAWLHNRDLAADERFWRDRVAALSEPTYLGRVLGGGQGSGYVELEEHWTSAETEQLQNFAKHERVTVNTVLQAAWTLLLHEYTGEGTVCFGATVSGRSPEVAGSESLIGLFINTVAVVSRVEGAAPVGEWLRALQASNAELREHEQTPLNEVQRLWGRSGQALFDSLLVFENYPVDQALESASDGGLKFGPVASVNETNYALTLEVSVGKHGLTLSYGYQQAELDELRVGEVRERLRKLVNRLVDASHQRVSDVSKLDHAERQVALELAAGQSSPLRETRLAEAFEEQVKRTPEAVALKAEVEVVSYAELNGRANQLARGLRARGVGANTLVALCVERSVSMVVGVLGVLKAGAAYLPLDPEYPRERLTYMLEDSGAKLLLADAAHAGLLADAGVQTLRLDADWSEVAGESRVNLCLPGSGDQAAYCIYTSGSTGRPKGVVGTQRGVLNRLGWLQSELQLTAADRVLQKTSLSFDVSVGEILWPLLNGGQLVLGSVGVQRDAEQLLRELIAEQITLLDVVPAQLGALATVEGLEQCTSLRCVTVGGEALPLETARAFRARHAAQLVNMYGPTEASIDVTYWRYDERERGRAPLGRPMSNTSVYVLNGELEPMGSGMLGELYIGGVALAHGYHGRAGLTGERFVPSPFVSGERLYRAGDLGRYRADGTLEYAGRVDDQVKVRGYRIELGEVEAKLVEHPAVGAAAVAVKQLGASRQLVGYVVGREGEVSAQELRSFLAERLPEYMVPAHLVNLQTLPLLANGKLDRKALPDPEVTGSASYVAPETAIERELAQIWSELLAVPDVSVEANFFELGGDSILSLQVVSRARARGIELTPKQVFEQQTIRGLGQVATFEPRSPSRGIARKPAKGEVALTAIQRRFFAEATGNKAHFNQALMLKPRRVLDGALLTQALNAVIARHDALRLRYEQTPNGTWRQVYADISAASAHDCLWQRSVQTESEQTQICEQAQHSLDLSAGPLLRAVLFSRWDGSQRLLVVTHHLVVDGVSWRVLMEDLETAYEQLSADHAVNLLEATASFGQWAAELATHARGDLGTAEVAYYEEQAEHARYLSFPGSATTTGCVVDVEEVRLKLSSTRTRQLLREAPSAYRTQVNDLLMTALSRAMCVWSGESAAWIELESHGRVEQLSALDVSRTVGWFASLYPVLLRPTLGKSGKAIAESICQVKEQLRAIPSAGAGYGAIEAYGDSASQQGLGARPHLTFNYLGQIDAGNQDTGLWKLTQESVGESQDSAAPLLNSVTFNAEVVGGELGVSVGYSRNLHELQNMQHLAQLFLSELEAVVEHCLKPTSKGATASDFGLSCLTQAQLQSLGLELAEVEDIYPATAMQQGMVFHSLYQSDDDVYVNQQILCVRNLDVGRFEAAWQNATARHDALRTGFIRSAGQRALLQVVYRHSPSGVRELDMRGDDTGKAVLEALARKERELAFDLARPPLQRALLVRTGEREHRLIWTYHHALLDGWSSARFIEEVLSYYASQSVARAPRRFRDYMAWYALQDRSGMEDFWRRQLLPLPAPTQLSLTFVGQRSIAAAEKVSSIWTREGTERLRRFAAEQRVTLNTLVQAAWALLLQQHTGQAAVCFGATVSGRPAELQGIEDMLGLFINTLPVIVKPEPSQPVGDWVRKIQRSNVQLREFEHTPLSDVQRWAGHPGQALFDTLLVFENYPVDTLLRERNGALEIEFVGSVEQTNYALTLEVSVEQQLELHYGFKAEAFDAEQVRQIVRRFDQLLNELCASASRPVAALSMLTPEERAQLVSWSNAPRVAESAVPLHQLIERRAHEFPDAIAVRCGDAYLSYAQLNTRANRLARWLRQVNVGPGALVGVCLSRSTEMVIAFLAVLKAGGAYLPLDAEHPAERLRYLIEDSAIALLLTEQKVLETLAELPIQAWCVERDGWQVAELDGADLVCLTSPEHAAYCIYTSGSTGKPKGAVLSQRGLNNHMAWFARTFQASPSTCVLQKTPISFDASVWEFWLPLMVGGRLVIATAEEAREPALMIAAMLRERVTTLQLVPQLLDVLLRLEGATQAFAQLEHLFCGGEALPPVLASELHALRPGLLKNLYGPTEVTIDATWWSGDPRSDVNIPIGRPIDNLEAWVLDPHLLPVAPGVVGELWLAGAGLAIGYHRRAKLTAERFVPHPFAKQSGERLYRTGDLVRWRADGMLDYVGRVDHQVKIRGHRIELGEIEVRLREHPALRSAVVVVRESGGVRQLVAYVIPKAEQTVSEAELRKYLSASLPEYMVPARGVALPELPLTAHGKVDRDALPLPERVTSGYRAPQTPLGQRLAQVWQEVLNVERVGSDDNFFELGGDSLLAMQVIARVASVLRLNVPLRSLFDAASLADFEAAALAHGQAMAGHEASVVYEEQ